MTPPSDAVVIPWLQQSDESEVGRTVPSGAQQIQQCVEPGSPPETDASSPFMGCQDETTGDGAPYLDFPCGCA
jgi:hypothetical protein